MVEGDLLHTPDSILPPAGCGDGVYQHDLGGGLRLVFFDEGVQKFEETAGELGFQDDGFREQTMTGALREELRLPCGVMGPFDLAPLAREASICLGVLIRDLIMHGGRKEFGLWVLDVVDCRGVGGSRSGVTGKWEGFGGESAEKLRQSAAPMGRLGSHDWPPHARKKCALHSG